MNPQFAGKKITTTQSATGFADLVNCPKAGNSGAGAMLLAKHLGAEKIIMLGFDCKPDADGKRHWHGKHAQGLGDAGSMDKWQLQFGEIVPLLLGIDVKNCSRETVLTYWERARLEDELC